ncbi:MAG: RNA polymerase sigma-70 factor [Chitinophagaceae bacterium]
MTNRLSDTVPYHEPALLQQVADGDTAAFARLFDAYERRLFTYAYKITQSREASEDIVQDIFLQVWNNRSSLPGIQHFAAYVHRSAYHAALKVWKQSAREELVVTHLKNGGLYAASDPQTELGTREVREQIRKLVDQLSPRQREVFLLHREEGLKRQEIADRLGIGIESVRSHLAEALRNLRAGLANEYGAGAAILYIIFRLGEH